MSKCGILKYFIKFELLNFSCRELYHNVLLQPQNKSPLFRTSKGSKIFKILQCTWKILISRNWSALHISRICNCSLQNIFKLLFSLTDFLERIALDADFQDMLYYKLFFIFLHRKFDSNCNSGYTIAEALQLQTLVWHFWQWCSVTLTNSMKVLEI